jgi:hypothetical protein
VPIALVGSAALDLSGEVPVQYYQSVIAIELAVAGALLFQVHYFDRDRAANPRSDPWMLLVMAIVIAATLFGCLEAMREGWGSLAAAMVTVGVAVSVLPILLRVLPPITQDLESHRHDPHRWVTVLFLVLYVLVVTVIVLIR